MKHSRNGARGEIAWNSGQTRAVLEQSTTRVCDTCRRFQSRRHKASGAGFIIPGEFTEWSACDCPPVEAT